MELGVLEIGKYNAQTSELLRRVRCLSGRVSVFRAQDKKDLLQYRKAIEGLATEDTFSLLLDGHNFSPKEHFFIGFGGRDQSPPPSTITQFFIESGIAKSTIPEILPKYLLAHLDTEALCTSLTPLEWRMVRQIACLEGTASAGLYFLHDPFLEFSEEAKEIFADKWANLAWKKKHIVVVTELSVRPEAWIDNDFIARIPLEKPRQATIGFGGTSNEAVQSMIAAVRAENVSKSKIDLTALSAAQLGKKYTFLRYPKLTLIGAITLIALLNFALPMAGSVLGSYQELQVAKQSSPNPDFTREQEASLSSSVENLTTTQTASSDNTLSKPDSMGTTAVSRYPADIQLALTDAIKHPESLLLRANQISSESSSTNYSDSTQDPFEKWYMDLASNR